MTKTVFFPFFHTISYYNHIISSQIRLVKSFSTYCGYNINMKFGKTLKELREEKGLSQMELARATGISQSAIAKWENRTDCLVAYHPLAFFRRVGGFSFGKR